MPKARMGNIKRINKKPAPKKTKTNSLTKSNKYNFQNPQPKGALVIGGGISGIQAALDLADAGIFTYVVDRSTSIGGRMAQLDKTFPTNDCAMCILSPKLVAAARHPNIRLLTNSEVKSVLGKAGNFKVQVLKYPRYIDEDKCVGCGECAAKCPTKIPNEFDLGLSVRKAIFIPFPQAVPMVYCIDEQNCLFLQKEKCGVCSKICKADAIDYEQKQEEITLDIGAIIVATGYEQFDPSDLEEFGYSINKNVITGLEFERLLNASGPSDGKILRPSDNKEPSKILFVQCIGSRDKHRAKEYCSRICCMYAIKEAMIAKEHQPNLTELSILAMEIRAYGKGFEEYYNRAVDEGINIIKGRPAEISEDSETGEVSTRFEDIATGEIQELKTDLVVLSSAVIPNKTNDPLSKVLGIELDENGFFKECSLPNTSSESTKEGIFISGCAQGPKDIPDSVAQGSAAAAHVEKYLIDSHIETKINGIIEGKSQQKTTTEQEIEQEQPRIGVFVCHCGINIAGVLDIQTLVDHSKTLPDVVLATNNLYSCSDDAQRYIQDMIKEHNLTRVVVASCTPRTHEPIFRDTCFRAGLNPYLFEMTNIRDQCSWVHMNEPAKATEKAKDLITMAIARARTLIPLEKTTIPIDQSVLVIGGGIAGIQCALDLGKQKIKTTLLEREEKLGGRLNQLEKLAYSDISPEKLIKEKIQELKKYGVKIYTGYKINDISGYVGNFDIEIESIKYAKGNKYQKVGKNRQKNNHTTTSNQISIHTGAIVIAIGSDLHNPKPKNEFGYGKYEDVITNIDFEERLKNKKKKLPENLIFIQCVGARERDIDGGNKGCSRYCCQTTLHQAVKAAGLGSNVTILHRGIRAFSKYAEELYYKASELGVRFIQFPDGKNNAPKIINQGSKVKAFDISLNQEIELSTDLIILSLAMEPKDNETEKLQKWLKIPRSADGFFLELHPKLAPVETNTTGIYLCGCAQGPKDVIDTMSQASAAAAKVAALVSQKELATEPVTAVVNEGICWGCGTCEKLCAFGAAQIEEGVDGIRFSHVNSALCKGCGVCASNCPSGAMTILHFTNEQIECMIKAFGEVTS